MNLRDKINAVNDRPMEMIEVPEWGGLHVGIRMMTALDRDRWEQTHFDLGGKAKNTKEGIRASLLVRCMVDQDGERIYQDSEAAELCKRGAAPIQRLFEAAMRVNKITKEDHEELVGNSEAAQPGG